MQAINPFVQSELGAPNPARGGRGPSTPRRPNGPLRGSESANVGGAKGVARSTAPPVPGPSKG
eukprot:11167082-Alexandrium_andersonii.AAC.1